mmetsp:Transcript_18942/g.46506  ORF Transcript_18942/g.46506 Transcript_18942/m.46506 type:complete len:3878 (+) Transcript_18942:1-11634(+)
MRYPRQWNANYVWDVNLNFLGGQVTLLRSHQQFFQDLARDWTSYSKPWNILYFYPTQYNIKLLFHHCEWIFFVNELNIMDINDDEDCNTRLVVRTPHFGVDFIYRETQYGQEVSDQTIRLQMSSAYFHLHFPSGHPLQSLLSADYEDTACMYIGRFDVKIKNNWNYFPAPHSRDCTSIDVQIADIKVYLYGFVARYLDNFSQNYFRSYLSSISPDEFVDANYRNNHTRNYWTYYYEQLAKTWSNAWETIFSVSVEQCSLYLPRHLYRFETENRQDPSLKFHSLEIDMRMVDQYSDIQLNVSPVTLFVPYGEETKPGQKRDPNSPLKWNCAHTYLQLASFNYSASYLNGQPPMFVPYRIRQRINVGQVFGQLLPKQVILLTNSIKCYMEQYKMGVDYDLFKNIGLGFGAGDGFAYMASISRAAQEHIPEEQDAKFVESKLDVSIKDVKFNILHPFLSQAKTKQKSKTTRISRVELPHGFHLDTSSQVTSHGNYRLSVRVPKLGVFHLIAQHSDLNASSLHSQKWICVASLRTPFAFDFTTQSADWQNARHQQREFQLEQQTRAQKSNLERRADGTRATQVSDVWHESNAIHILTQWDEDHKFARNNLPGSLNNLPSVPVSTRGPRRVLEKKMQLFVQRHHSRPSEDFDEKLKSGSTFQAFRPTISNIISRPILEENQKMDLQTESGEDSTDEEGTGLAISKVSPKAASQQSFIHPGSPGASRKLVSIADESKNSNHNAYNNSDMDEDEEDEFLDCRSAEASFHTVPRAEVGATDDLEDDNTIEGEAGARAFEASRRLRQTQPLADGHTRLPSRLQHILRRFTLSYGPKMPNYQSAGIPPHDAIERAIEYSEYFQPKDAGSSLDAFSVLALFNFKRSSSGYHQDQSSFKDSSKPSMLQPGPKDVKQGEDMKGSLPDILAASENRRGWIEDSPVPPLLDQKWRGNKMARRIQLEVAKLKTKFRNKSGSVSQDIDGKDLDERKKRDPPIDNERTNQGVKGTHSTIAWKGETQKFTVSIPNEMEVIMTTGFLSTLDDICESTVEANKSDVPIIEDVMDQLHYSFATAAPSARLDTNTVHKPIRNEYTMDVARVHLRLLQCTESVKSTNKIANTEGNNIPDFKYYDNPDLQKTETKDCSLFSTSLFIGKTLIHAKEHIRLEGLGERSLNGGHSGKGAQVSPSAADSLSEIETLANIDKVLFYVWKSEKRATRAENVPEMVGVESSIPADIKWQNNQLYLGVSVPGDIVDPLMPRLRDGLLHQELQRVQRIKGSCASSEAAVLSSRMSLADASLMFAHEMSDISVFVSRKHQDAENVLSVMSSSSQQKDAFGKSNAKPSHGRQAGSSEKNNRSVKTPLREIVLHIGECNTHLTDEFPQDGSRLLAQWTNAILQGLTLSERLSQDLVCRRRCSILLQTALSRFMTMKPFDGDGPVPATPFNEPGGKHESSKANNLDSKKNKHKKIRPRYIDDFTARFTEWICVRLPKFRNFSKYDAVDPAVRHQHFLEIKNLLKARLLGSRKVLFPGDPPPTFTASEVVSIFVSERFAMNRLEAVQLGRMLQEYGIISPPAGMPSEDIGGVQTAKLSSALRDSVLSGRSRMPAYQGTPQRVKPSQDSAESFDPLVFKDDSNKYTVIDDLKIANQPFRQPNEGLGQYLAYWDVDIDDLYPGDFGGNTRSRSASRGAGPTAPTYSFRDLLTARRKSVDLLGRTQIPMLTNGLNWAKSVAAPIMLLIRQSVQSLPRRAMNELQLSIENASPQNVGLALVEAGNPSPLPLDKAWVALEVQRFGAFSLSASREQMPSPPASQLRIECALKEGRISAFEPESPLRPHVINYQDCSIVQNQLQANWASISDMKQSDIIKSGSDGQEFEEELSIFAIKLKSVEAEIWPSFANFLHGIQMEGNSGNTRDQQSPKGGLAPEASSKSFANSYVSAHVEYFSVRLENPGRPSVDLELDDLQFLSSQTAAGYEETPSFGRKESKAVFASDQNGVLLHLRALHMKFEDSISFEDNDSVFPPILLSWKLRELECSLMSTRMEDIDGTNNTYTQKMLLFNTSKSKIAINVAGLNVAKIREALQPFMAMIAVISDKKSGNGQNGNNGRNHQPPVFVRMDSGGFEELDESEGGEGGKRNGKNSRDEGVEYGATNIWRVVNSEVDASKRLGGVFTFKETTVNLILLDSLQITYDLAWFWLRLSKPKANEINLSLMLCKGSHSSDGREKEHACELVDKADAKGSRVATVLPSVCVSASIRTIGLIGSLDTTADRGNNRSTGVSKPDSTGNGDKLSSGKRNLDRGPVNFHGGAAKVCQILGNVAVGKIHLRVTAEDLFNLLQSDSKLNAKIQSNLSRAGTFFNSTYETEKYTSPVRAKDRMDTKLLLKSPVKGNQKLRSETVYEVSFALYLQGIQCDFSSKHGQRDSNYVLSLNTGKFKLTVKHEHNLQALENHHRRLILENQSGDNKHTGSTGDRRSRDSPSVGSKTGTLESRSSNDFRNLRPHDRSLVEIGFEGLQITLRREMDIEALGSGTLGARNEHPSKFRYKLEDNGHISVTTGGPAFTFEDTLRMNTSLRIMAVYDSRKSSARLDLGMIETLVTVGDNVFSTYKLLAYHLDEIQKKFFQNLRSFKFEVDERITKTFRNIGRKRGAEFGKALNQHSTKTTKEINVHIIRPRVHVLLAREATGGYRSENTILRICTVGFDAFEMRLNHSPEPESLGWVENSSAQPISGKISLNDLSLNFIRCVVRVENSVQSHKGVAAAAAATLSVGGLGQNFRSRKKVLPLAVFHDLQRTDRDVLEKAATNCFIVRSIEFAIEGLTREEEIRVAMIGHSSGLDLVADPSIILMVNHSRRFLRRIFQKIVYFTAEGEHQPKSPIAEQGDPAESPRVQINDENAREGKNMASPTINPADGPGTSENSKNRLKVDVQFSVDNGSCFLLHDTGNNLRNKLRRYSGGVLKWLLENETSNKHLSTRFDKLRPYPIFFTLPAVQMIAQLETKRESSIESSMSRNTTPAEAFELQTGFCLIDISVPENLSFGRDLLQFWRKSVHESSQFEEDAETEESVAHQVAQIQSQYVGAGSSAKNKRSAIPSDPITNKSKSIEAASQTEFRFDVHITVNPIKIKLFSELETDKDGVCLSVGIDRMFMFFSFKNEASVAFPKDSPKPDVLEDKERYNRAGNSWINIRSASGDSSHKLHLSTLGSLLLENLSIQIRMNRETVYTITLKIGKILGNHSRGFAHPHKPTGGTSHGLRMSRLEVGDAAFDINLDEYLFGALSTLDESLFEEFDKHRMNENARKDRRVTPSIKMSKNAALRPRQSDVALVPEVHDFMDALVVYFGSMVVKIKVHELADKNGFRIQPMSLVYHSHNENKYNGIVTSIAASSRGFAGDFHFQNKVLTGLVELRLDFTGFELRLQSAPGAHSPSLGNGSPTSPTPHDDSGSLRQEEKRGWAIGGLGFKVSNEDQHIQADIYLKKIECKIEHKTKELFHLHQNTNGRYVEMRSRIGQRKLLPFGTIGTVHLEKFVRSRRMYRRCDIKVDAGLSILFKMGAERSLGVLASSFNAFRQRAVIGATRTFQHGKSSMLREGTTHGTSEGDLKSIRTGDGKEHEITSFEARQVSTSALNTENLLEPPIDTFEVSAERMSLDLVAGDMTMEVISKNLGVQLEEEKEGTDDAESSGMRLRIHRSPKIRKTLIMWVGSRKNLKTCHPRQPEIVHFSIHRRWDLKGVVRRSNCINVSGFFVKFKADEELAPPQQKIVQVEVKNCDIMFDSAIIVSNLNDIRYLVGEFGKSSSISGEEKRNMKTTPPPREYNISCSKDHFFFKPNYQGGGGLMEVDLFNVLARIKYVTGMNLGLGSSDAKELILPLIYKNGVVSFGYALDVSRLVLKSLEENLR